MLYIFNHAVHGFVHASFSSVACLWLSFGETWSAKSLVCFFSFLL